MFNERNIAVLCVTSVLLWSFEIFWMSWCPLYLLELGATKVIVGTVAAAQALSQLICTLLGGMLADRLGRKKIFVYGTAVKTIFPVICIFAGTWQQLALALIVKSAAMGITINSDTMLVAESLSREKRGMGFGAYRAVAYTPTVFIPILSGIYIDQLGLISVMRSMFYLCLIGDILLTAISAKFIRETLKMEPARTRETTSFGQDFSELFKLFTVQKAILVIFVVSTLSMFSTSIIQPFLTIYAVDVLKFTKTEWGLIQTTLGTIGIALSLPSGMLSDRFGRRYLVLSSKLIFPFQRLILILLKGFDQMLLLSVLTGIGASIGGGAASDRGGPAWEALIADLVPSKVRGKTLGLMATISGIVGMPASIIGGLLWTGFSPETLVFVSFSVGMAAAVTFLFVKEPKMREK